MDKKYFLKPYSVLNKVELCKRLILGNNPIEIKNKLLNIIYVINLFKS